jgi:hypothetical protein
MKPLIQVTGVLAVCVALFSTSILSAQADTNWQKKHPRREQVNKRLKNQQNRVDQGLANGQLKPGQAEKIQNQDSRIRNQERRDASQNGGHITQGEQNQINREENHTSREINRDEKNNASQPAAQPPSQ